MISFNSNKKLESAFKNATLCHIDKSEKDIIAKGMLEVFDELKPIEEEIGYIGRMINEETYNVVIFAMYLYPGLNLKEAVKKLYKDIKLVEEKFEEIDEEAILKNVRTPKDVEDEVAEFGKKHIAKTYYLKEVIKAAKECALF